MRRYLKSFELMVVLMLFGIMVLGSGSDASVDDKKEIVVNTGESTKTADTVASSEKSGITISEQVMFEKDGLRVTATEYVTDSIWGDGIELFFENNSTQNLGVSCKALIVNDYMISDLFSTNIAAGKKDYETLFLSSSELRAAGIENVGQIELYFYVFDSDSFETLYDCDCVTIQTSEYTNIDITPADVGQELYNENGIRIVGKFVDENSFWGAAVLFYLENKSGKNVYISVDNLSINGFMMTPYFSTELYDGKMSISDITLMSSELEQNGISSIDDIELAFKIIDENFITIDETEPIKFSTK